MNGHPSPPEDLWERHADWWQDGFTDGADAEYVEQILPLAARWLDVGSWPAYGDAVGRDGDGNAVGAATAVLHATRDSVVASSDPQHLVALVGCDGLVVVHTPAATLVMPAAEAQRVKELHAVVSARYPRLS